MEDNPIFISNSNNTVDSNTEGVEGMVVVTGDTKYKL
jgi:hypothetical protein